MKRIVCECNKIFSPELVPHDTVVKELVSDTVDYGAELGVGGERFSAGSFSQALFVSIKVILSCLQRSKVESEKKHSRDTKR